MAQNSTAINKTYSLEDCATHNTEKDCWLIIHGKVYDVTNFLDEHPGGYDIVVANTGMSLIVSVTDGWLSWKQQALSIIQS